MGIKGGDVGNWRGRDNVRSRIVTQRGFEGDGVREKIKTISLVNKEGGGRRQIS